MTPISNIQHTGMFLLSVLYSYLRFEHIQKEKETHYTHTYRKHLSETLQHMKERKTGNGEFFFFFSFNLLTI